MSAAPVIATLAAFAAETPASAIPSSAMRRAEDCVLDAVGAALLGVDAESSRIVRSVAKTRLGDGRSAVWFHATEASVAGAVFSNAMAASAADIDDGNRLAIGHPGAGVVSAALAAATEAEAGGADLLGAIVMGYEVGVRIAKARRMEVHRSTSTGRWVGTGVAAAVGRLRRLAPDTLAAAILIAEQQAPGLLSADLHGFGGSHVKEGIAWSALGGLFAVDLAALGFRPYPRTLELEELYRGADVIDELASPFLIERTFFKPYAVCRWIHPAIDALSEILARNDLAPSAIQRIGVATFERAVRLSNQPAPADFEAAQFSLPFALAVTALHGRDQLLPLNLDLRADPRVIELGNRVELAIDADCERKFPAQTIAEVSVETAAGRRVHRVDYPLGDPANPMDRTALQDKFRQVAGNRLASSRAAAIIQASADLESAGYRGLISALKERVELGQA